MRLKAQGTLRGAIATILLTTNYRPEIFRAPIVRFFGATSCRRLQCLSDGAIAEAMGAGMSLFSECVTFL